MNIDLSVLNKEQSQPVMDTEGAIMVTAGAGSGKTRLLTHRISYIVSALNVPAHNILAITFTNKAAKEMKERLQKMLSVTGQLWVSTFHSMCVTILRRFIHLLGYNSGFSIYDESERKSTIKKIAAEIDEQDENLVDKISFALSTIKNEGMDIDEYLAIHKFVPHIDEVGKGMYRYESAMKKCNALDFDDLLVMAYTVLAQHNEAREYYQNRFKYIHVDEFQDTNIIQYKIIKLLAGRYGNVFVVGDEDQSIYGWRGANIGNIKDFLKDFKDCRVYKLEQNYRSTKNILNLANSVIKNNTSRIEKKLWTENTEGAEPVVFVADSDGGEADFVMQNIKGLHAKGMRYSDMAVLMRVNSLSRSIEQKFMFYNIPYKVFGGFKFYDRREVKDALAYLKLLCNPFDNEAVIRAISFPKKGIGETSVVKLLELAARNDLPLLDVILSVLEQAPDKKHIIGAIPNALKSKIIPFATKIKLYFDNKDMPVSALLKFIFKTFEFDKALASDTEDNESRRFNLRELVNSVVQTERANPDMTLDDYMQQIMLYSDLDAEITGDSVTIATIHSAKGLEYNAVFIVGLEDGLFPLSRAVDNDELEEERRLMYVAITRARQRLFLSYSRVRFMYGKYKDSLPSRFLKEAGIEYNDERKSREYGSREGYGARDSYGKRKYGNDYSKNSDDEPLYPNDSPKITYQSIPTYTSAQTMPKSDVSIKDITAGTKIHHRRFGEGTVISVNNSAGQADIEFENMGKVTLSIAFAPIEIIK